MEKRMMMIGSNYPIMIVFLVLICSTSVIAQDINVRGRGYTSFPSPQDVPANTKRLFIENNHITTIATDSMAHLTNLAYANFGNNKIETMGDIAAVGSTLTQLFLYRNPMKVIPPGTFNGLDKLTTLQLDECQLTEVPELQDIGDTLVTLYLNKNPFKVIAKGSFDGLDALTTLYLDTCQLEALPDLSQIGDTLKKLYVKNNPDMENPSDELMSRLQVVE